MNYLEIPIWISGLVMAAFAWVAGYLEGKAAPSDAAALLVASRIRDKGEYMSPGQLASIVLPAHTRSMNFISNILKLGVLGMALATTWWLRFPSALIRMVATAMTERLFANWTLDYNCYWILGDLHRRMANWLKKGDQARAETAQEFIDEITLIWEDAKESGEIVPPRMEIAKEIGLRRSL